MRKGTAKVSWDSVCLGKVGLGIQKLEMFNITLMNFWDVPYRGDMNWGWKKLLQVLAFVCDFIWYVHGALVTFSVSIALESIRPREEEVMKCKPNTQDVLRQCDDTPTQLEMGDPLCPSSTLEVAGSRLGFAVYPTAMSDATWPSRCPSSTLEVAGLRLGFAIYPTATSDATWPTLVVAANDWTRLQRWHVGMPIGE
nr:hypothetical protein [Tanacetum cinerariifolium]